jgi:hypothetical protein
MEPQNVKWFLVDSKNPNKIFGPMQFDQLASYQDQPTMLAWQPSMKEWLPVKEILKEPKSFMPQQNIEEPAIGNRKTLWSLKTPLQERENLSYPELLKILRDLISFDDVWIWSKGYPSWLSVFEVPQIIDDLGISRRKHPRAPISGKIFVGDQGQAIEGRLQSISEGGVGARELPALALGSTHSITIKSPALFSPVNATAEVVFVDPALKLVGFKFCSLGHEARSLISEYISKFDQTKVPKLGA